MACHGAGALAPYEEDNPAVAAAEAAQESCRQKQFCTVPVESAEWWKRYEQLAEASLRSNLMMQPEPEIELDYRPTREPEPVPELEQSFKLEELFDRYGIGMDSEHAQVYARESEESAKEAEREAKWAKMLGAWELYGGEGATNRRAAKLKRRVRKGIPVPHRGRAWFLLCGAREQMAAHVGVYHDLSVVQPCEERYENQIKLDISRTITDHRLFREDINGRDGGQQVLYRVLRAYAVYNHKVAYCQGMSYIAGMILCQGVNEEEGFWMLRQFMNEPKYNLCGLYEDGFPLLNRYLDIFTQLLFERYPDVAEHVLKRENVVPIMFGKPSQHCGRYSLNCSRIVVVFLGQTRLSWCRTRLCSGEMAPDVVHVQLAVQGGAADVGRHQHGGANCIFWVRPVCLRVVKERAAADG